ncbi:MAG TPA: amino acid permease [Planctomycetota bacterium]|nr:amino acid permease [Planctomycetota bacterium]
MAARQLNSLDATLLVMGGIVGVGIFYTPHAVAQSVPQAGPFLAMWVLGGLVALNGALTFAELGGTFPKAGGWYVFLREAFGPFIAYLFAWVVLCVISTGAIAVMIRVFVDNLPEMSPAAGHIVGGVTIAVVTGVAAFGAKAGATVQNLCMLVKLSAIAAMAVVGLLFAAPHAGSAAPAAVEGSRLASGMLHALLPVLFACGGWQMLCYVAPQIRDPQRTLPRAIVLGILGVIATYLLINAAYVRVLGIEGLAADPKFAGEMARRTLGGTGGEVLRTAMAISALGVAIVTIMATPWLYVAMARERLFFTRFADVHPRTGAPIAALVFQGVVTLGYWSWGHADVLVNSVVFVEWIFHALVAVALLRLRATRPDLPRPFRSPFYPLAPVLYVLFATGLVLGTLLQANVRDTAIGLSVLAVGAIVYRPWRRLVAR